MNRSTLSIKTKPALTNWKTEVSRKVRVPKYIEATSIEELRSRLQELANTYRVRPGSPSLGELEYRYELDDQDMVTTVHAYFVNKEGRRRQFVRLHRDP